MIATLLLMTAFPLADCEAEVQVTNTLAKLTLDEKVSLLGGIGLFYLKTYPEYGMPAQWSMSDGSHGLGPERGYIGRWNVQADDRSTVLPALSALACTWNVACAATHGEVMGEQVRAYGKDQMLGPGVNIMRNPLCGRNWEYFSEDPCLAGELAAALITFAQRKGIACTVKHFAANSQELDRMKVDTRVDERTLNEIYFPAFETAVKKGGVLSVMTAYNKVNGLFASENPYLETEILRQRWGFKGMTVSDWGGQHSCVPAALAGADVEMSAPSGITNFTDHLRHALPLADAVRRGEVPERRVDEMASHVLYMMAKTGALDANVKRPAGERLTPRHRALAQSIAEEAIVLLKNDEGTLPLATNKIRSLVVLGQLATTEHTHLGNSAAAHADHEITPLEGLRTYLGPDVKITYFPLGAEVGGTLEEIDATLVRTYDPNAGESFDVPAWDRYLWKEGQGVWEDAHAARSFVKYPAPADAIGLSFRARVVAPESGAYTLLATSEHGNFDASLFVDGVRVGSGYKNIGGEAVLEKGRSYEIRLDVCNPGARACAFRFGWTRPSVRKLDVAGREATCKAADAVLAFTGTSLGWGRAREQESFDRPNMLEPVGHDEAIAALIKLKLKRLIVINHSGSPMEMPWADDCPTLVQQPYLGQESGLVLARVLFGEVNPSGKLPCTWPRRWEDTPVAQKGTYCEGTVEHRERFYVGYRWYDKEKIAPLFPFGHGLAYTTFAYANAKVKVEGPRTLASIDVTNTGAVAGRESVQLYVASVDPKVERCVKDLRAFAKTRLLQPGETETLTFELTDRAFSYYDVTRHDFVAPAGAYRLLFAASAADIRQELTIERN